MTIDKDRSFEVSEDGLTLGGNVHVSSGIANPTHTSTEGGLYFKDNGELWKYVESEWVRLCDTFVWDTSSKPIFHTTGANDGELDYVEYFKGATQTTINRRGKVTMAYDGSLNPISETWLWYDPSDGTTVLYTYTIIHTWISYDLTKSSGVLS